MLVSFRRYSSRVVIVLLESSIVLQVVEIAVAISGKLVRGLVVAVEVGESEQFTVVFWTQWKKRTL